MRYNLPLVTAFVVATVVACADQKSAPPVARADSATVAAMRAESVTASHSAAVPSHGLWDLDRVSERLVRSGVAPRRSDSSAKPPSFLSAAKQSGAFDVGRDGSLRVFIFADSSARRSVTDQLDPLTASPRGQARAWPSDPVLIVVQNLMAVMMGGSPRLQERVKLALEAGIAAQ